MERKTGTFRRLDERVSTTAPLPIAWLFGIGLGALVGLAFHAWETLVLRVAQVAGPPGEARSAAIAASALAGAAIGAWGAVPGLYGPRWASACAVTLAGWLLGAPFGAALSSGGVPAVIGVAAALTAGIVGGQVVARIPGNRVHLAIASGLVLAGALLVP